MPFNSSCKVFRIIKQLCNFSPDGKFLALVNQSNISIKNTGTFDNYLTFTCSECIEVIKWSPDSQYILSYSIKNAVIQIFSINYPEWNYKLIEGSSGLDSVFWTPDSRHIVTIANLKIQLAVWCLVDNSVLYIQNLKTNIAKGIQFSPNGKYLSLTVNENGQDRIHLYKTNDWKLSKKLIFEGLHSIDGFSWSPNSETICVWCAISGFTKIIFHSFISEIYEGFFHLDDGKNNSVCDENIFNNLFVKKLQGLEIIKWIPSGQLLALSGHNETIVLLNYLTWNPFTQLRLDPVIKEDNYLTRVFKECSDNVSRNFNKANERIFVCNNKHILQEIVTRPINIPIVKSETLIGRNPASVTMRMIDTMEFSICGQYLAVRHQIYPETLWVWDIRTNGIDILILKNTISAIKWDPIYPRLLIFTKSVYMFEWNPNEIICLNTPQNIKILNARWHPSSDIIALCGYNCTIIYYLKKMQIKT